MQRPDCHRSRRCARERDRAETPPDKVPVGSGEKEREEADHVEREHADVQKNGEGQVHAGQKKDGRAAGEHPAHGLKMRIGAVASRKSVVNVMKRDIA